MQMEQMYKEYINVEPANLEIRSRILPSLDLKALRVLTPLVLAPMAGVTDAPFRRLCRRFAEAAWLCCMQYWGKTSAWKKVKERGFVADARVDHSLTSKTSNEGCKVDDIYLDLPSLEQLEGQTKSTADFEIYTRGQIPQDNDEFGLLDSRLHSKLKVAHTGLFISEMINAKALVMKNEKTWQMLRQDHDENLSSRQLYAVEAKTLCEAIVRLCDLGLADHIDLNFGCPVPKVTRLGGGSALPWKLDLFEEIVSGAVKTADLHSAGTVPVTLKLRLGIDDEHYTIFDCLRIAQDIGVSAVTVHARTLSQYYHGLARWQELKRIKDMVNIPILGNGDIFSLDDALAMLESTGCDGLVIGRGCQGKPWIFAQILPALWGVPYRFLDPNLGYVAKVILLQAKWMIEFYEVELLAMQQMRKHILWYLRGFSVGGKTKAKLSQVKTITELEDLLSSLDLAQPTPLAALGPRGRTSSTRVPHLPEGWLKSRSVSETELERLSFAVDGGNGG